MNCEVNFEVQAVMLHAMTSENYNAPTEENCINDEYKYTLKEYTPNSLNLSEKILRMRETNFTFCSFEIIPPTTAIFGEELFLSVTNLERCSPLFYSITWHSGLIQTSLNDCYPALRLASAILAKKHTGQEILLHLAIGGLSKPMVINILEKAKKIGVNNIFALRGDGNNSTLNGDFPHAFHLVQFIREHFGNQFVICVAGYPVGHPGAESYDEDLMYLKKKVDAGADFIITQIVFEAKTYLKFVKDCRHIGITAPILPGIMPIQSYSSLLHISKLCCLNIPKSITEVLEPIKDNNKSVRNFGIHLATEIGKQILSCSTPGLHFFTMNRESAVLTVCKQLGFGPSEPMKPLQYQEERTVCNSDSGQ